LLRRLDALAALTRATPVFALLRALFLLLALAIHLEPGKHWRDERSTDRRRCRSPGAHRPERSRKTTERKTIHVGVS
jgi:hypothetical protein